MLKTRRTESTFAAADAAAAVALHRANAEERKKKLNVHICERHAIHTNRAHFIDGS